MSERAILAGFLMLWLKKYIVPTPPLDAISMGVIYPAAKLACVKSIAFLLATISNIQSGLRTLSWSLCDRAGTRISLAYTYLMAWYSMHCPSLIDTLADTDGISLLVHRLEVRKWMNSNICFIRRTIENEGSYSIAGCYPKKENTHDC